MCSPALLLSWRNGMTVIRSAVPVRIGVLICIGFLLIAKSGCLEGEIIRAMTRLCVFEHYAFRVEGLPGNNCKRVITFQIQTVLIHLRNTLYGDGALAHDDRHPKIFLNIVIDGMDADLPGEPRHQLLVIEIDIEYAGITVQGTDTLYCSSAVSSVKRMTLVVDSPRLLRFALSWKDSIPAIRNGGVCVLV